MQTGSQELALHLLPVPTSRRSQCSAMAALANRSFGLHLQTIFRTPVPAPRSMEWRNQFAVGRRLFTRGHPVASTACRIPLISP